MTQRTEARFKVFSKSDATVFGTFKYNTIDFNVGGTYDTSTYEYTVDNAGTYLIGYSFVKKNPYNNNDYYGGSIFRLTRGDTTYTIGKTKFYENASHTTLSNLFMYKFEVGDKLKIIADNGQPKMNRYNGFWNNNILNSWWGIKLNY